MTDGMSSPRGYCCICLGAEDESSTGHAFAGRAKWRSEQLCGADLPSRLNQCQVRMPKKIILNLSTVFNSTPRPLSFSRGALCFFPSSCFTCCIEYCTDAQYRQDVGTVSLLAVRSPFMLLLIHAPTSLLFCYSNKYGIWKDRKIVRANSREFLLLPVYIH